MLWNYFISLINREIIKFCTVYWQAGKNLHFINIGLLNSEVTKI